MIKYVTTVFTIQRLKSGVKAEDPKPPTGNNWRMVNFHPLPPNPNDMTVSQFAAVWEQETE